MAHNVEPMDIDNIESDFDNKENSIHHSNVYPRTPCTEKGYEELDVSELNMKLRYSITPAASPMSKSYTANCADNRNLDTGDDILSGNLTRSLNAALSKADVNKSVKTLPLQTISTEQFVDSNRNASVLRQLDTTVVVDNNVTVTVTQPNEVDENLSFPSSSSSTAQTPEATTPTKEMPRADGGSPIMRGLKSVLNMFRSSQSPIPPVDNAEIVSNQVLSPADTATPVSSQTAPPVLASTPIAAHRHKDGNSSKRCSPHKESLVFNEDLEKELLWKDETTILFSQEKIPIHKLFFQQAPTKDTTKDEKPKTEENLDMTVEYMDISYNDSMRKNKTITDLKTEGLNESDSEFVDCETTFTDDKPVQGIVEENQPIKNESESNETQTICSINNDASVQPTVIHESLKEAPQPDTTITQDEYKDINLPIEPDEIKGAEQQLKQNENNVYEIKYSSNIKTDIIKHEELSQNHNTTYSNNTNDENVRQQEITHLRMNMTFEDLPAQDLPAEEIILRSDANIVNSTMVMSESAVDKTYCAASQDHVSNSTFVHRPESPPKVSDVCNSTYSTKCDNTFVKVFETETSPVSCKHDSTVPVENASVVKDVSNVSLSLTNVNNTTTIVSKVENTTFVKKELKSLDTTITMATELENATFVKDHENLRLSCDNSHNNANVENSTFIKDDIKVMAADNNKTSSVGYNTFVEDIINECSIEDKVNSSTPSTEAGVPNSPENIPLPDEDDIENEKSLGASMLVEEKTLPVVLDIYNTSEIKLDNAMNVDEIPIDEAKSINVNSAVNYLIKKDSLNTLDTENKLELPELPVLYTCEITDTIREENQSGIVRLEANKLSKQNGPMDINDSIIVQCGSEIDMRQSISTQPNLDVNVEKLSNVTDQEPYSQENYVDAKKDVSPIPMLNDIKNLPVNDIIHETFIDQDAKYQENELKCTGVQNQEVLSGTAVLTVDSEIITSTSIQNRVNETVYPSSDMDGKDQISEELTTPTTKISTECPIKINETDFTPAINETFNFEETAHAESVVLNTALEKTEIVADSLVEEIALSKNNSPFEAVPSQADSMFTQPLNFEEVQNPFATKSRVVLTPPSSPKIVSKGYNFNFDEIDDPFATKTKIRVSPTPEVSPKDSYLEERTEAPIKPMDKNRRKSQPERKKPLMSKKKLNSTYSGPVKATKTNSQQHELPIVKEPKPSDTIICNENEIPNVSDNIMETAQTSGNHELVSNEVSIVPKEQNSLDDRDVDTSGEPNIVIESKALIESINTVFDETRTSSSDQSTYYSAGTSSSEGSSHKNVFNIPEIDDMNFNPFVTKSKMRQSPPPGPKEHRRNDTIDIKDQDNNTDSKPSDSVEENANISNITNSSKATDDKDVTVREVHTEDEDTEEGPFLEPDDNDKMSDFDGEDVDMMQFSELPPQNNEENLETGEMFIDAEAFEFLLNQNKSNVVSDSGKESLFLKFDPLFAKRVSTDGVLAALNKVQKRQSTPKKMAPPAQMDSTFAIAGPSNLNVTREVEPNITAEESIEDLNVTVSKPMMVVTPAVNPIVTPRNKTITPTSSNRRSITFTSPAIAVIDRLLSLSANNSLLGHDTTVTVSREQSEADLALTQLRELLAEKEINVYSLRSETKELKDRLSSLESQMRTLESESEERLRKVNELNEKLSEKTKINKSMAAVVEEYERTIASLIAETEQDRKRHNEERIKLIKERDEQTAHLASMEVSFSDLHSKYEKSKQIILTCKANEDSYKKSIKEFEENLSKMQSNYELLKQHATSKLNHANQELEKMNRAHESEVLKMNAMIKRKELHITSLEETLAQKTKANEELTAICDELINKVG